MMTFINFLEDENAENTRMRAVLKRSFNYPLGTYYETFRYIQPWCTKEIENSWKWKMHSLVAALWALHWTEDRKGAPLSLGAACAAYQNDTGSTSIEARLISMLNADEEQLPVRLRHLVSLLKDYNINFDLLLNGLMEWRYEEKKIKTSWARHFYLNLVADATSTSISTEEMPHENTD